MGNSQIYPKNMSELFDKLNYIVLNDEDETNVDNINRWLSWIKNIDEKVDYKCEDNEYLKAYIEDNKYSLQVWKHDCLVDSLICTLISNHYSNYTDNNTKVIYND